LNVATAYALRTTAELVGLVEAIRDAPAHEPETDFVEWKGPWNIGNAADRFHTARHLLGFGNRTVFAASQQLEGCAYFVAGAEPGNVVGTAHVDPASIDDQLSKYILPGQPRWTPAYVTVDGNSVLVITVETPRAGDPIFTLQQGYGSVPAGRVFVRRHGKTEEAGPADIRALEARGLAASPKVELAVTRTDDGDPLRTGQFTERDAWLAAERDRLLEPFEKQLATRNKHQDVSVRGLVVASVEPYDPRGAQRFRQEVDEYLEKAPERWLAMVIARSITRGLAPLRLQIVNPTERNFDEVEVGLTLPGGAIPYPRLAEARAHLAPPNPPNPWGQGPNYGDLAHQLLNAEGTAMPGSLTSRIRHDESGHTVRFLPTHVRPGETVALPPIYLVLPRRLAGQTLAVGWRLTSTTANGWQEDEIVYDVATEPVEIELLPRAS
jgi:hypothetical protein